MTVSTTMTVLFTTREVSPGCITPTELEMAIDHARIALAQRRQRLRAVAPRRDGL